MSVAPTTIRVIIPLTIRKRNGRPKILPPADMIPTNDGGVDPHVLKAIARAWSWRRKRESGAATTIQDIATAEDISDRYVGRMLKLAYLAPTVLEKILIARVSPAVSLKDLASAADLPWREQVAVVFDRDLIATYSLDLVNIAALLCAVTAGGIQRGRYALRLAIEQRKSCG